uniref:Uncharacterized protein n=1 Tax=Sphaerodactylus townsendi TaxID=933632 RepID=A0ACB8EW26_9SAUR
MEAVKKVRRFVPNDGTVVLRVCTKMPRCACDVGFCLWRFVSQPAGAIVGVCACVPLCLTVVVSRKGGGWFLAVHCWQCVHCFVSDSVFLEEGTSAPETVPFFLPVYWRTFFLELGGISQALRSNPSPETGHSRQLKQP